MARKFDASYLRFLQSDVFSDDERDPSDDFTEGADDAEQYDPQGFDFPDRDPPTGPYPPYPNNPDDPRGRIRDPLRFWDETEGKRGQIGGDWQPDFYNPSEGWDRFFRDQDNPDWEGLRRALLDHVGGRDARPHMVEVVRNYVRNLRHQRDSRGITNAKLLSILEDIDIDFAFGGEIFGVPTGTYASPVLGQIPGLTKLGSRLMGIPFDIDPETGRIVPGEKPPDARGLVGRYSEEVVVQKFVGRIVVRSFGFDYLIALLWGWLKRSRSRARDTVLGTAEWVLNEANKTVPFRTGALMRSGHVRLDDSNDKEPFAYIAYSAHYAGFQHESVQFDDNPGRRITGRRAKWLELTIMENRPTIDAMIREGMLRGTVKPGLFGLGVLTGPPPSGDQPFWRGVGSAHYNPGTYG